MAVYKIYLLYSDLNSSKETAFFNSVLDALKAAFIETKVSYDFDGLVNMMDYREAKTVFKEPKITPPSVVFIYPKTSEKMEAIYLRNIGNQTAWQKNFETLINGGFKPSDNIDVDVVTNNGSGGGYGNGNGLGIRPCIPVLDEVLESLGLGKIRQMVYGVGAAALGYQAVKTESKIFGAGAVGLAYLAATMPTEPCSEMHHFKTLKNG